ncbi:MAG: AbrB/MazE/SpoVT family DNA-binding domain-containing protein [Candidatus Bathyarchaeia archaeon]
MDSVALVRLSSKGQLVIPKAVREKLGLKEGDRLLLFSTGNLAVLRKVEEEESLLSMLSAQARARASKLGLTRADVEEAVREARKAA